MKKTIGEKIAILRKSNNLSQKELADKLNISNKTISKWECDNGEPDLNTIKQIASIFNTSIDSLLNDEIDMNVENIATLKYNNEKNTDKKTISKKLKYILVSSFSIILSIAIFLTCFFTIQRQPNITSNELDIDYKSNTINLSVSNNTASYSFINKINVPINNEWHLYSDLDCNNEINSQTISLEIGDNIYYILVKNNGNRRKVYTVNIRRKPKYYVNINTQGGSTSSQVLYVEEGENFDISTISIPTKNGYTFKKWSDFINPIITNTYINAEWIQNEYNVTLNHNGGNYSINSLEAKYDNYLPNQSVIPQKLGYAFNGYFSSDNEMYYNSNMVGVKQYKETRDLELFAKFTIINYNIQYVLNGGTDNDSNLKTYNVEMDNFQLINSEKNAYEFINWTSNGEPITTINTKECENLIITANFTPIVYTITYIINDGINNENNPTKYTIESPTITLKPAVFENENVSRWYLEDSFNNRINQARDYLKRKIKK